MSKSERKREREREREDVKQGTNKFPLRGKGVIERIKSSKRIRP